MIPEIHKLFTSHNYPEKNLFASSSVLHEVKHPTTVPPSGHPQGGGTFSIEYVLVVIYLWLVASN